LPHNLNFHQCNHKFSANRVHQNGVRLRRRELFGATLIVDSDLIALLLHSLCLSFTHNSVIGNILIVS
jgi:hypothetical protein